jgi:retinol-binding protein 3
MKTMYKNGLNLVVAGLLCLCFSFESNSATKDKPLDAKEKKELVEKISALLNTNYVFPEVAAKMRDQLTSKFEKEWKDKELQPREFMEELNRELVSLSADKHIKLSFSPGKVKELKNQKSGEAEKYSPEFIRQMQYENYGFREAVRLPGNIGYLNFWVFADTAYAAQTAISALNFLGDTDALI